MSGQIPSKIRCPPHDSARVTPKIHALGSMYTVHSVTRTVMLEWDMLHLARRENIVIKDRPIVKRVSIVVFCPIILILAR